MVGGPKAANKRKRKPISFHMLWSTMMKDANHWSNANKQQSFTIIDGKEKQKWWTHCMISYYFRLSWIRLNWKLKEKIGGLTCGSLLNTSQPSTCLRDKAELLVALFTDIHPAAINQNCTGIFSKSQGRWQNFWACGLQLMLALLAVISTQVAIIPIHLPIFTQLLRKVSSLNHVVHLWGCFTPVMKSPHRNKVGYFTQRSLNHWCWFVANHQYPNKTSTLTESLNYLFWKMLRLEKP